MSVVKEDLILPEGFSIYPYESYIRIGRVERVSLISRDMDVQFIDGEYVDSVFTEEPVVAVCVVGSDEPSTTYAPSASVYGRGDIVCVILTSSGELLAVSLADMYTHSNRENFALVRGWALYDTLNGVLVDILDAEPLSHITFWDPASHIVTKIVGDPSKRHVLRRILDHFLYAGQNSFDCSLVNDGGYPVETLNGGPKTNLPFFPYPERKVDGKNINGFGYVEDKLFGQADMTADLTMYHSTLTGLYTASIHPEVAAVIETIYESATILWFSEEDPDYVLVACCFPAWDTAQYINFIEVPVYSLAGRKFLERDESGDITLSWQRYADQVREIATIQRSYIDWTAHGGDVLHSERLNRGLLIYTPRNESSFTTTFGFIDGYGYDQSGVLFDVNKLKKVEGTITRSGIQGGDAVATNGSPYSYSISHNNPVSTGTVDNWYSTRFQYEYNAGDPWEEQTCNDNTKVYPHFTDGTNTMHRTVDFEYHCDGWYDGDLVDGRTAWSDRSSGANNAGLILNQVWHRMYRNDVLLYTDHFRLEKNTGNLWGYHVYNFIHYADVSYNLYVIERIEVTIDESSASLGPGAPCTGTIFRTGLVMFEGVETVIWTLSMPITTFPTIWNFWPWVSDSGAPDRPTPPDSSDSNHNSVFYYPPFFEYYTPELSEYSAQALNYPAPSNDICSTLYINIKDGTEKHKRSDYLQVSIDTAADSFSVRFQCFLDPAGGTLNYPNTEDICFRFNSGAIHFNKPVETGIIDLSNIPIE